MSAELQRKSVKACLACFLILCVNVAVASADGEIGQNGECRAANSPVLDETKVTTVVGERQGWPIALKVHVRSALGTGRLLLDVTGTRYASEVQESIKKSLEWAFVYSGLRKPCLDFVVSIEHNFSGVVVLDGPSLGPALAVLFVATLEKRDIASGVVVTGRLGESGNIGQIGDLAMKADAAKATGAAVLLVPKGQDVQAPGLSVIEVSTMDEVIAYMLE